MSSQASSTIVDPSGLVSVAQATNDTEQVIGFYTDANLAGSPDLLHGDGVSITLDEPRAGHFAEVWGDDNAGQVAVSYLRDGDFHGFFSNDDGAQTAGSFAASNNDARDFLDDDGDLASRQYPAGSGGHSTFDAAIHHIGHINEQYDDGNAVPLFFHYGNDGSAAALNDRFANGVAWATDSPGAIVGVPDAGQHIAHGVFAAAVPDTGSGAAIGDCLDVDGAGELGQHIGGHGAQDDLATSFALPPSPTSPGMLQEEIDGASAAYAHAVPQGATPLDNAFLTALDSNINGFSAQAFQENGAVFIAFEGTQFNASAYGLESIGADIQILEGHWPVAFTDAILFSLDVESLAGSMPVYVTGHSLGGGEAEAVTLFAANPHDNFSIAGGVTFGAPGLPGYYGPQHFGNLTDFIDYGDPVGNYGHDTELAGLAATGNHFGTVAQVGPPADAAAAALFLLSGNVADAFQFHALSHYADDLGLTIDNSVVAEQSAVVADQSHDAALTQHVDTAAAIPHFDVNTALAHAHDFLV